VAVLGGFRLSPPRDFWEVEMNANELKAFIRQISKEKDLDVSVVKEAIEQAIVSASKKNLSQFNDARPDLDAETGQLHLYVAKEVVNIATNPRTQVGMREAKKIRSDAKVGETVEVEIDPALFGRIAAQSARQVVMQKLRDAERMKVYDEFQGKVGEVVSGSVQRYEKRDVILTVGKAEVLLPRNEIPMTSHYRMGDRIKAYVLEIDPEAKGPIIKVSRTHPQLVAKLFEQEVPEIADGTVKVVNVVREPGARAKIAVESTNSDVDPVGACVGVKGTRVQMIVRELENEKIDIVPYNSSPKQFITNALVPAQILTINLHEDRKQADVIVKKGNLSLAIGKKGQNAKLAAKLTGWKLDIHSEAEEEKLGGVDQEEVRRKYLDDLLGQISEIDAETRDRIYASEFNSVEKLAHASIADVSEITGDGDLAEEIVEGAKGYLEALREMTRSNYGDEPEEAQQQPEEAPAESTETTELK
jgi:transcription termination/antitermination protein NusA